MTLNYYYQTSLDNKYIINIKYLTYCLIYGCKISRELQAKYSIQVNIIR